METENKAGTIIQRIADEVVRVIENKWGEAFAKLALMPRIRTAAVAARRNTTIILARQDGSPEASGGVEACTLRGTRREQFLRLCELKKSDRTLSLRRCAKAAMFEVRGEDGYRSVGALVEYAVTHRSWWLGDRNENSFI